ncbi:sugar phosphate isomerase/epimerase [Chitinophaga sedimenti]|uniref:sugar phosphate isomerase/epimerase family protein n=1 Tax=Chitinophaga sedimenti TaxID=2033606 RepID=UPI0020039EA9|nr:sugar phosphate isomerase/epimerase family protein [Chitinophaga sedimenti]MCK7555615.1 sugar phosphate isomerase/epimerase [Chitinophaga sedimenti]
MKKLTLALALAGALWASPSTLQAQDKASKKLGWKLGAQSYTFNRFTLAEALNKLDSCGLSYVEMYPGQNIGGGIEGKVNVNMDEATQKQVLALLKKHKIQAVAFGVVGPRNAEEWEQTFKFAKGMGIGIITAEPRKEHLDVVSGLCDKYQIKIAIHDHPKPSQYWHPDTVLAAIKGRSPLMGACADIGHWVRSGLDPVECIQKLNGHIHSLHFKDLNEKAPKAHDVIWGTGVSNVRGVLEELKKQGFKGVFSAEYEYHWENSVPEVRESVKNWREMVKAL